MGAATSAPVDPGLISVSVIAPFLLIFFNVLVMAHYIDPEAAAGHYIAKLFILFGMLLAECTVLLLPLDVGNGTGATGCGVWNNWCPARRTAWPPRAD